MFKARVLIVSCAAVSLLAACPSAECSETEACASGFVCSNGVCVASATDAGNTSSSCGGPTGTAAVPNLLTNAGFECGTQSWGLALNNAELSTETANPKSGATALKLTLTHSGQGASRIYGPNVPVQAGDTLCARAWFRGTSANGHLTIFEPGNSQGIRFSTPITANDWVIVPPSAPLKVPVTGAGDSFLQFSLVNPNNGDTLIVDDADFWKSPDGSCSERG